MDSQFFIYLVVLRPRSIESKTASSAEHEIFFLKY